MLKSDFYCENRIIYGQKSEIWYFSTKSCPKVAESSQKYPNWPENCQIYQIFKNLPKSSKIFICTIIHYISQELVATTASDRTGILTDLVKIPFLKWCQSVKLSEMRRTGTISFLHIMYLSHVTLFID